MTEAPPYLEGLPEGFDPELELGKPGSYPYTRGVYPNMYRGRLWTMRQYAGFGTARETNRRYRFLLERGTTGLSAAFDLPTQMGYDSDHEMANGEVGRVGVAIDSLRDMRALMDGIDLSRVSLSMTINATAPILLALYVALADERGVPRKDLRGTVQNDILKEYVARGTYIYPVEPSLRLAGDLMEFCGEELPKWNPISVSGYHIREAGSTAAQEVAFTLSNALAYARTCVARGMPRDRCVSRMSFFFAAHNDLFEEVAKFRAARRLWARTMHEDFGADRRAVRLRFHTQTGGSTLTAQEPENNVVRVAFQALAAVLGGTQSLHSNGFDEALSLPTRESARLALRTQQVLALESGVSRWVDPLAGSYVVERLTRELEEEARSLMRRVEELGGAEKAIEFMQEEIHRAAYAEQLEIEAGRKAVVGVNRYRSEKKASGSFERPQSGGPDFPRMERRQLEGLAELRRARDARRVERALEEATRAVERDENVMESLIRAVREGATLGEISNRFRGIWGGYGSPSAKSSSVGPDASDAGRLG